MKRAILKRGKALGLHRREQIMLLRERKTQVSSIKVEWTQIYHKEDYLQRLLKLLILEKETQNCNLKLRSSDLQYRWPWGAAPALLLMRFGLLISSLTSTRHLTSIKAVASISSHSNNNSIFRIVSSSVLNRCTINKILLRIFFFKASKNTLRIWVKMNLVKRL